MARKGHGREEGGSPLDRLVATIESAAAGMHWLGSPAILLDAAWPQALAEVYRRFDGAELFLGTLTLMPATQVQTERRDDPGATAEERSTTYYRVGQLEGDDLYVDDHGQVWRLEEDTGEWLAEGSRLDRWLLGVIEAQGTLYDREGEFSDEAFDEEGDVTAATSERMHRRILKRDRDAVAPRWRLARALVQQGNLEAARDELETAVATQPAFAWAWFDLGRISERLGELGNAVDEMEAAAQARPDYEHAGYFWAQAARLARAAGDEARREACTREALARSPGLVASQRDGARESLESGELEAARELIETAAALAPRDLMVMDLMARIHARIDEAAPPA
jgi:tetratricopeptide (TPR) repeat protein